MFESDLAFGPEVAVLQEKRTITWTVDLEDADMPMLLALFGDPAAVLWWEMSKLYQPMWWHHETT